MRSAAHLSLSNRVFMVASEPDLPVGGLFGPERSGTRAPARTRATRARRARTRARRAEKAHRNLRGGGPGAKHLRQPLRRSWRPSQGQVSLRRSRKRRQAALWEPCNCHRQHFACFEVREGKFTGICGVFASFDSNFLRHGLCKGGPRKVCFLT